jgi:putative cell wall-binding protein
MSAGSTRRVRRVAGSVFGAILAVAVATAGVVGLSSTVASATTAESTTVSLNPPSTARVTSGSEPETFTGTVTGQSGDGYPKTGAVKVVATNGSTVCTGSLTAGTDDAADFTCVVATMALGVGTYKVHAHYTGGQSSTSAHSYTASTSGTQSVTVATPASLTPTVSLEPFASPVTYGSEAQTFKGTVTGQAGDGYPKTGAVTVKTSTNVVLCTGSLSEPGSGAVADFTCDASTARKLAAGQYSVHAHYTGGVSSDAVHTYAAATSAVHTLVVTGAVPTTTTLSLNHASRKEGAESSEVSTVTVTGRSGDGYPKGRVTVDTTTGSTVCSTGTRRGGTADSSKFTCSPPPSALPARTYELSATYVPASTSSSSTSGVSYTGSTSKKWKFTVAPAVETTGALSLSSPSERAGSETAEVFTVKVAGKSGDGYPKGTVRVKTTSGTLLCTRTAASRRSADSQTFACSPPASALGAGTFTVVATYTPATPSSSNTSIGYAASTSNTKTFAVTEPAATRIYGATPDATASEELESVYPGTRDECPGRTSGRPVVLATDEHYPDALAASYLEKWLGTGMLLTPANSVSSATFAALRVEGITDVYVVGGPLAVSTSVVSQLERTDAYECGGATPTGSHITVFRIYGQTQYATAEEIAETPGPDFPKSADLQGAYGLYDDAGGNSSAAPRAGARRTAILASGAEFQDAEASAALAYADGFPLLLTTSTALSPQALGAITALGITQVILMGGPLAVSNAVVTALVSHKVSVIRVAGSDYTDTAVQLADMELGSTTGHRGLGWSPTRGVAAARGDFYTDGLAGAIVAAHGGATGAGPEPLLLTESPTSVGSALTSFLEEAGSKGVDGDGARVTSLTVLGGPLALTTTVVSIMVADL